MARYLTGDRGSVRQWPVRPAVHAHAPVGLAAVRSGTADGCDPRRPGGARRGRRDGRFRDLLRIRAGRCLAWTG